MFPEGETAMIEVLSRFEPGQLIGLVAVVGGLFCGMTGIVMGVWHANRKAELDAALKQSMLDRGMSPGEIQTVMEAGSQCGPGPRQKDLSGYLSREV